jgi:subfamily B ATP-binding cassette protein MsbA
MSHGRIVEQGTHHELLALNGHYAQLYNVQQLGVVREEVLI